MKTLEINKVSDGTTGARSGFGFCVPTCLILLVIAVLSAPFMSFAQQKDTAIFKLKKLTLEELLNVDVTSVSLRPEKITEVSSAIQVISGEDIHRSVSTRLPEALRLASNLYVARSNSHDWAITARGFNGLPSAGGILANKLLVMIDGRSVYNPLFGGVYWDVQNTLMEDLDRIEIVSGPGGTQWGANAVNGVLNVITKSAKETQEYMSGRTGSMINDFGGVRFGGRSKADSNLYFRIYGQHFDEKGTLLEKWERCEGQMEYDPGRVSNGLLSFPEQFIHIAGRCLRGRGKQG